MIRRACLIVLTLLCSSRAFASASLYHHFGGQVCASLNSTFTSCTIYMDSLTNTQTGQQLASNDLVIFSVFSSSTVSVANGTNTTGCTSFTKFAATSSINHQFWSVQAGLVSASTGRPSCVFSVSTGSMNNGVDWAVGDTDGNVPKICAQSSGQSGANAALGTDTLTTCGPDELVYGTMIGTGAGGGLSFSGVNANTMNPTVDPLRQGQVPVGALAATPGSGNAAMLSEGWIVTWIGQHTQGASVKQYVGQNNFNLANSEGDELAVEAGDGTNPHNIIRGVLTSYNLNVNNGAATGGLIHRDWENEGSGTSLASVTIGATNFGQTSLTNTDNAMLFDPSNNTFIAAAPTTFNFNAYSHVCVIQMPSGYASGGFLLGVWGQAGGANLATYIDNSGHVEHYFNLGSAHTISSGTTVVNDGNPHLIVVSYNGSTVTIYVGSTNVGSGTVGAGGTSNGVDWFLGFGSLSNFSPAPAIAYIKAVIGTCAEFDNYGLSSTDVSNLQTHISDGTFDTVLAGINTTGPTHWIKGSDNGPAIKDYGSSPIAWGLGGSMLPGANKITGAFHLALLAAAGGGVTITPDASLTSEVSLGGGNIADKTVAANACQPYGCTVTDTIGTSQVWGTVALPIAPTGPGDTVSKVSTSTTSCAAGTTCTINIPATPTANNLGVCMIYNTPSPGLLNRAFTYSDSSWTNLTQSNMADTGANGATVLAKILSGSETNFTITLPVSGSPSALCIQYSGEVHSSLAAAFMNPAESAVFSPGALAATGDTVAAIIESSFCNDNNSTGNGTMGTIGLPAEFSSPIINQTGPSTPPQVQMDVYCHTRAAGDARDDTWTTAIDNEGQPPASCWGLNLTYIDVNYSAGCSPVSQNSYSSLTSPITFPGLTVPHAGDIAVSVVDPGGSSNNSFGNFGGQLNDQLNMGGGDQSNHIAGIGFAAGATGNNVMIGSNNMSNDDATGMFVFDNGPITTGGGFGFILQ